MESQLKAQGLKEAQHNLMTTVQNALDAAVSSSYLDSNIANENAAENAQDTQHYKKQNISKQSYKVIKPLGILQCLYYVYMALATVSEVWPLSSVSVYRYLRGMSLQNQVNKHKCDNFKAGRVPA